MKYISFLLLISFFSIALTDAQTLYWVGGSGNWNDQNHWSLQSGGNGGTLIPNKDNDVVFDEKSFQSQDDFIIVDKDINCYNFNDESGIFNIISASENKLNVFGNYIKATNSSLSQFYGYIVFNKISNIEISIDSKIGGSLILNNCQNVNFSKKLFIEKDLQIFNSHINSNKKISCKTLISNTNSQPNIDNSNFIFSDIPKIDNTDKAIFNLTNPSSTTTETCYGDCDGTITISLLSGNPTYPLTITVNRPNGGGCTGASKVYNNIMALPYTIIDDGFLCGCAVAYSVNVKDFDNTSRWTTASITGPPEMLIIDDVIINPSCFGVCDGSIEILFIQGATYPVKYLWSNNDTTELADTICAGVVSTVTVTDVNSCTGNFSYSALTEPPELTISLTSTNVTCNGFCDGIANVVASGGTTPYSYLWDDGGGSTTDNLFALCAGIYSVTVTDAQGCEKIDSVTITEPAASLTIDNIVISDVTPCFGDANGSITLTVSGGTSPYIYSCASGVIVGNSVTGLSGGTYDVTVTDNKGCTAIANGIVVGEPALQIISITGQTNILCNGICNGTATSEMFGGTTPYTYLWDSGTGDQTTATASNLCAGTYSVTGTDFGGCTATTSVTITEPSLVTVVLNSTNPTCNSSCDGIASAVVSGGTTPYSYVWCNGSVANNVFARCAGVCGLTVTDGNGCVKDTFVTFIDPPIFGITMSQTNVSCNGVCDGDATATPTGGVSPYIYGWSCGGQSTQTAINLCAGICNVTVVDGGNCQSTASVTIIQPATLTASIVGTDVTCNGSCDGTADLTVVGGTAPYNFNWSNAAITEDLSGLCAGIYDVTVTDSKGCQATASVTINEPALLTASIVGTDVSCNGSCDGTADLTVVGGTTPYNFNWSNTTITEDLSGLCAGTYDVTVTDSKGCQATASVTINEPALLTASIVGTDVTCNGSCDGIADLTVAGGTTPYNFNWSNAAITEDLSGICAGIYDVTVTDSKGCQATASVTINEPALLTASIVGTDVTCNGSCDGTADLTVAGGTSPYNFNWSNATITEDLSGLCAGIYTVTVTDAYGCQATASVTINEPALLTASIVGTDVTCNSSCDGTADLTVVGGTTPYNFNWSNAAITEDLSGLCPNIYSVTVTDANGCQTTASVTINEPALLTASIVGTNVTCNGNCDGTADLTVAGGTSPYNFNWSNAAITEDLSGLCPNIYSVTVTDTNGCEEYASVTITEPGILFSTSNKTDVSCNGDNDGTIDITTFGGTTPYTYIWNDLITTEDRTNLSAGTYCGTVTDFNGCTFSGCVDINEPPIIDLSFAITDVSCTGNCDGAVDLTISGGNTPYSYIWSNAATSQDVTLLCEGEICVTVNDATGCSSIKCDTVRSNSFLMPPTFTVTDVTCAGDNDGAIDVTVVGGNPPITYQWLDGPTTEDRIGLVADTFCVTITDGLGLCKFDTCIVVNDGYTIDLVITKTDVTCNGNCDGTATVNPSGGVSPYTYLWDAGIPPNNSTTNGLCTGIVNLTVTDANNCSNTGSANIGAPSALDLSFTTTPLTCSGDCDATATAEVSGGTSPYTYLWDAGGATGSQTNIDLCAGVYNVTVTDASSCTVTDAVTIVDPAGITVNFTNVQQILCSSLPTVVAGQTYLPDGTGVSYTTTITHTDFAPGQTITSANDIASICANMEHSYLGDLIIEISCPNDLHNVVLKQGPNGLGGNCNLGEPIDDYGNNNPNGDLQIPGVGYDYCWTMTPTYGTMVSESNNYTHTYTDADGYTYFGVDYLPSGSYAPFQNFSNLVGCEINGDWTIKVTDQAGIDNGFIFSWQLNFDPSTFPNGYCTGEITAEGSGGNSPYTYQWSNGSTLQTISDLCAGNYCVTITGTDGCSSSSCVTITEPPTPLSVSVLTQNNVSCNGMCNASVTLDVSGGTSPYTYKWDDNQTTNPAVNLCAGVFNCTVYDANLCEEYITVTITEPATGVNTSITAQTNVLCNGNNTGSATVTVVGGTSPYDYDWSGALPDVNNSVLTSNTVNGLIAGIYSVTVTDFNSCSDISFVTITQPTALIANLTSQTDVSCKGGNNGTATLTVSGGTSPYTYLWSNGEITNPAITMLAGIHTVTVTDANNCTATASVTITEPALALTSSTVQTDILCNGDATGSATVTPVGGTSPYTYDWSPSGPPFTGEFTNTYSNLTDGIYSVDIKDANNCSTTSSVTITENSLIVINGATTDATCGICNGEIDITVSGGVSPYSFIWSSGQSSEDLITLCAGSYTITVTDAVGCIQIKTFVINNVGGPTVTIDDFGDASCFGVCDGWANASASGGVTPYTILWSTGDITLNIIDLCAGVHTLTVTDANSCLGLASVTIDEPSQIVISFTQNNVTCNGSCDGLATAVVSGGTSPYLYSWTGGSTASSINGLCAGVYDVTVTDSNGCFNSESVTITEPNAILVNIDSQADALCNTSCDGNAILEITGGTTPYTIIWCNGETGLSADSLCAGNCDVTITDGNACGANKTVTISAPTAIVITPTKTDANCGACDGSIILAVSGGTSPYSYLWGGSETTQSLINLCPDSYTVTVTDDNGCTSILTIDISNIGGPSVDLSDFGNCSCFGVCDGWVNPIVTGGVTPYTYLWSSGDSNLNQSGLCAGVYTITVTGANGCIGVESVTITEPTEIDITFTQTNVSCNLSCDGSATALVSGGTSPYTYLWSNSVTTATINNLCAGVHDVTVTDANNCSNTASVTITEPNIIIGSIISQTNVSCFGDCDGSATISVSGGTSPYIIDWCGVQTGVSVSNLCAGICAINISDANNCLGSASVTITEPSVVDITYTKIDANCGASNGSIDLTVTGGTIPYGFIWSNGATTEDISGLIADSYTVTVTDGNGCTATLTIDINDIGGPTVTIDDFGDGTCFNSCDGFINITATLGVSPYTYSWSGPGTYASTDEDITLLCGGVYTVSVTGSNGCISVSSVTITPPTDLDITFNQTNVACNGNCNGTATAIVSGGTSPYTYLWCNGAIINNVDGLCAGVCGLTVTDISGCQNNESVTITQSSTIAVNIVSQTDVVCNGEANGKATISVSGGTNPYIINWCNGESGLTANLLPEGDCIVTITDASSCSTTKTITTTQPDDFTVSIDVTDATCGNSDGEIDLTVSGATPPYTFVWSSGDNTEDIILKPAGLYSVTITDANSCDTIISNIPIINLNGPVITTDNVTDVTCFGLCDGEIYVSVSGGVTPYTYNWSNSDITDDIIDLCAGIYSLTVTGADGCQSFASYTITEPAQLDVTISKTNVLCNGDCTGEIILTVSGGTTPYIYSWSGGQTTSTISNLCAGNYCITITDANNCTLDTCINITEPALPLSVATSQINATCFGMCDASAIATASGGTTPYTYLWNDGLSQTTDTAINLCAGVYACTVTDFNGCDSIVNVTITQPIDGVTATIISQTDVLCFDDCNGRATVSGSGGTTPYTYIWNGGSPANEATDTLLCAQVYDVTITDQMGCVGTASVTITEPDSLYAVAVKTDVTCNGNNNGTIDVTVFGGTPPYTFEWSDGIITTEDRINLSAGVYCGTVTDANGCTFSGCVTINENSAINASVQSQTDATCNGDCNGTATLSINGGTSPYSYIWSNGETGISADSLCAGINIVTVTDNSGCGTTVSVTINEPNAYNIVADITNTTCGNSTGIISLIVTGETSPYTYNWSPPGFTGQFTSTYSDLPADSYTVTISNAAGCDTNFLAVVTNTDGPVINIDNVTNVTCFGSCNGAISITVTGGITPYTYSWSNGATTEDISGLCADIYVVTVTGADGCFSIQSVTITQPNQLDIAFNQTNITCFGFCNGSASAIVTGGTSPYNYAWSSSESSNNISNKCADTYTLTITDNNNCEAIDFVTITEPAELVATISSSTDALCKDDCNGTATVDVIGGTLPYSYIWSHNPTTSTINGLCDGTYLVTITDGNSCSDVTSVIITEPTTINVSFVITNSHCTLSDGAVTTTVSGGTPPYTYLWSLDGETTADISGKPAGSYILTTTDDNGCESINVANINDENGPNVIITDFDNPSCPLSCDGSATVSVSGGTSPYTILWSTGATSNTITNLCDGVYTVESTDVAGCVGATSVTITDPAPLAITFNQTNVTCNGNCDGFASAIVSGGTPPYVYNWSNAISTFTNSALCAGTYTLTVTDNNLCTKISSVTITEPDVISVSVFSQTNVNCNGSQTGSVTLLVSGGSPAFTYQWSDGQTSNPAVNLFAGIYTVTIKDANNCSTIFSVTITEQSPIVLAQSHVDANCNQADGSATVIPSGGVSPYTIVWLQGENTFTLNGITAGSYPFTVTDALGCTENDAVNVSNIGGPTAIISFQSNPLCFGDCNGTATVTPSGGMPPFSIEWPDGSTNGTILNLCDGIYGVTVTDVAGCMGVNSVTMSQPLPLSVAFISTNTKCNGTCDGTINSIVSGGTPAYTYNWSNSLITKDLTSLCAGTYTLTVTDANSCTVNSSVTITEPDILTISLISQTDVNCNGDCDGEATIIANGGTTSYTYSWFDSYPFSTRNDLCAGNNSLTVTDNNDCPANYTVTINEPTAIVITQGHNDANCNQSDGDAWVTVSGGSPVYSYLWNYQASTNDSIINVPSSSYTVSVKDDNNCESIETIFVNDIGGPVASIISQTNPSCNGDCNGEATVSATGGVTPYTYLWDNDDNTPTADSLCAGTHTVTVFDANTCKGMTTVTITEPGAINIDSNIANVSCFGLADGAIDITVSGGYSPYTFLWTNDSTTEDLINLPIGVYCVTVTDANSCSNTACYTITEPANALTLGFSSTNLTCYNSNDGAIDLTISGGTTPYNIIWSEGSTTEDLSALAEGNYCVTVTDANGCSINDCISITMPSEIIIDLTITESHCTQSDGCIIANVSGGISPYTYNWTTPGSPNETLCNIFAGTYFLTVTDANGCTKNTFGIVSDTGAVISFSNIVNVNCNGECTGSATATLIGGSSLTDTYVWSNGDISETADSLCAGTVIVTVTTDAGCVFINDTIITQPQPLGINFNISNVSCFNGNNGSISVIVSGGTSPYTYNWSDGSTTASLSNLIAGTYSVTVTDANGCTISDSTTITQPATELTSSISGTNVLCNGGNSGTGTVVVSGGTSPYTYLWSSSETTSTATMLIAGWNYVSPTDASGCQIVDSIQLSEPSALVLAVINVVNSHCTLSDGSATIIVSGGTQPYSYLWDENQDTSTVDTLHSGVYMPTVTDLNGCQDSIQVNISDQDAGTIAFTNVVHNACYGDTLGTATASITGGTPAYIYNWVNINQTDSVAINLSAGVYTVSIIDAMTCKSIANITITQPPAMQLTLSVTNITCYGSNNGSIDLEVSGGSTPYTYEWSNGSTTEDISGLSQGTYLVTVTDANGCKYDSSATITQPDSALTASVQVTNVLCNGGATGAVDLTVSGGTSPFTFAWDNLAITEDLITVYANIYMVTITDANNCILSVSATVTEPTILNGTFDVTEAYCGSCDGSAFFNVSGGTLPHTYKWSTNETTNTINNLCVNFYFLTVTDANACTYETFVEINDTSSVLVNTTQTNVTCNGNCDATATAIATGGTSPYSYLWTPTNQTTATAIDLCSDTYTVVAVDSLNCADAEMVIIPDVLALDANLTVTNISCFGKTDGSITTSPTGGTPPYSIIWDTGSNDTTISGLPASTHYITITDANGCITTDSATVIEPAILSANISNFSDLMCYGICSGTATAEGIGGTSPFSYLWSNADTTALADSLCANIYDVTITDSRGCFNSTSIAINQPQQLTATFTDSTRVKCNGGNEGTATITPSGGTIPYSYEWSHSNTLTDSTAISLFAGTYTVTTTDFNGCTISNWIEIIDTSNMSATLSVTQISCFGKCDGAMTVLPSGGTPPYSYIWIPDGETTITISDKCAGEFSVTVYDANMCSRVRFDTLIEPSELSATIMQSGLITCHDSCNGEATISPIGGSAPYTFIWNNSQTDSIAINLCNGTYKATVTDSRNCSFELPDSVIITAPTLLSYDTIVSPATCEQGTNDGAINLTINGGVTPYSILWSNDSTTQSISSILSGYYDVSVTDALGCKFNIDSIFVNPQIILTPYAGIDTSVCFGDSIMLTGSGGINYLWNHGETLNDSIISNPLASPTETTEYILTIFKSICSARDTVTLTVLPLPNIDAGLDVEMYFFETITLNATSYDNNITSYIWRPNINITDTTIYYPTVNPETSTVYIVYATNTDGCVNSDSVLVSVIPYITFPTGFTPNGDGKNDVWEIGFLDYYPQIEVSVYNRWGEELFYSKGYQTPWDGTFNGKNMPVGTYYYLIKLNIEEEKKPITGPITIIR